MNAFTFRLLEDGRSIECEFYLAPQLTEQALFGAFKQSEFGACRLLEEQALEAMATVRALAQDGDPAEAGREQDAAPDPLYRAVIAEKVDASATLQVSTDRMMAQLSLVAARGGRHLESQDVHGLLRADKVTHGIDEAAIADLLERARGAEPGSQVSGLVARGRRPEKGVPSEFRCLVTPFQERILAPRQREDGTIDMRDLGDIDTVQAGDAIMERIPAHPGAHGYDVHGHELPSQAPKETPLKPGKNTEISPDDDHRLIASCAGVPHRRGQSMDVDDVLLVQDVDLKTGHLRYEGSVFVKGDVIADMRIEATGDVVVNGFVENAEIHCGGDLIVKNSILGRPTQGSEETTEANCRVSAQNITAHYAQHATLDATDTITMRSQMLYCRTRSRRLEVGGERQRRAKLIGGLVKVREAVVVGVAGAEAATRTRIYFDLGMEDIDDRLEQARETVTHTKFTMHGLIQSLERLQQLPATEVEADKLQRIRNTIAKLNEDARGKQQELERLEEELAARREAVRFHVHGQVYPGVELYFLDDTYYYKGEMGRGIHGLNESGWAVID